MATSTLVGIILNLILPMPKGKKDAEPEVAGEKDASK
jgi:xanthine/uracil permease